MASALKVDEFEDPIDDDLFTRLEQFLKQQLQIQEPKLKNVPQVVDDAEIAFQLQLAELASDKEVHRPAKLNRDTGCYAALLELEDIDYVPNYEPFDCPICFVNIDAIAGVWLRNCHHKFCKECIANVIKHSDEAEIACPFVDGDQKCNYLMTDREIRAIVTTEHYEKHLEKSLLVAERTDNSFHCRTPNCKAFCFFENGVNEFVCSICQVENCLKCSVWIV